MVIRRHLHHSLRSISVDARVNSCTSDLVFPKDFISCFLILSFVNFEIFLLHSSIDVYLIVRNFRQYLIIWIWRLLLLTWQMIDLWIRSDQRLRDGNLVELVDEWWLSFHLTNILGFVYQLVRDLELVLVFYWVLVIIRLVSTLVQVYTIILVLLKRVYFINWPFKACERILPRLQDEIRVRVPTAVVAVLVLHGVFRAMCAFIDIWVAIVPIDLTLVTFETEIYERACSWSEVWVRYLGILPPNRWNIRHSQFSHLFMLVVLNLSDPFILVLLPAVMAS